MIKRREFRLEKGKNVKDTKRGNVKITASHKEETQNGGFCESCLPPPHPHPHTHK